MYSLYSFLAAGPTSTRRREFQFFGEYPIMAGKRIATKLDQVHEHLVKQHFFPRDLHRSSGGVGQRSATIEHQASLAQASRR